MRKIKVSLTICLTVTSVLAWAQTPAGPADKPKPIKELLTFAALFMHVEKISPLAAQTLDVWHRFANEPPAAIFVSNPLVDEMAYKGRVELWGKLEEFFDTQLEARLVTAQKEGRTDAIEAYKLIIHALPGEDVDRSIRELGQGSVNVRMAMRQRIAEMVRGIAVERAVNGEASLVRSMATVPSDKFDNLVSNAEKVGKDAAITIKVWQELQSEPISPKDASFEEFKNVLGPMADIAIVQLQMDVSLAKLNGILNAEHKIPVVEAFKSIVGSRTILCGGNEGSMEDAIDYMGDFNQPTSMCTVQFFKAKMFPLLASIVTQSLKSSPPTTQPTK